MTKIDKFTAIAKALDRYEGLTGKAVPKRFDRFIDLDVCKVNIVALNEAKDEDFMHDMNGIFENLVRDSVEPENSKLEGFVPRVGLLEE